MNIMGSAVPQISRLLQSRRKRHSYPQPKVSRPAEPADIKPTLPLVEESAMRDSEISFSPSSPIDSVTIKPRSDPMGSWIEDVAWHKRHSFSRTNANTSLAAAHWMPSRAESVNSHDETRSPPSTALKSFLARSIQSAADSSTSSATTAGSLLPGLQTTNLADHKKLKPVDEKDIDPISFDLVTPAGEPEPQYSLEARSELLFSVEHLKIIFGDPKYLQKFTHFLYTLRPGSVPILLHYLNSAKALKAVDYALTITNDLAAADGSPSTEAIVTGTISKVLLDRANQTLESLAREELPAYVTHVWAQIVRATIKNRIADTLPIHLRELSEGLAEVFCLTDPTRHDNPIIFASEEFHEASQYGARFALGRNCRFLQGPKTAPSSIRRLRETLVVGKEHCETLLNYRRDGSVFMNLLMITPLYDNRGVIRYYLGAQVDVSGLVEECAGLESLERLVAQKANGSIFSADDSHKDTFRELAGMFNLDELKIVREIGGMTPSTHYEELNNTEGSSGTQNKLRLLIKDDAMSNQVSIDNPALTLPSPLSTSSPTGRFEGILEHYLIIRPFPSMRILFASPSLRVPGILQSPFLSRIGGSGSVRDAISQAFMNGRGVIAKVRWLTRPIFRLHGYADMNPNFIHGRSRWIHTTPLLAVDGAIGAWVVVLVDDEEEKQTGIRGLDAPPVDAIISKRSRPFE
ncbi:hypothetical protein F5Y19DRAFT_164318 [Xylariaceae sp. FL1651]|nr:hypothetical protein F5Y19DRAFT_164318 [Xylariaceae sp. FL1651]